MVNLFKVAMHDDLSSTMDILKSGYVGQGKKVDEFESLLKKYFDNDNLLYVNSCTSAIHLCISCIKREHNLPDDTEVLCTALSCFATAQPILANNLAIKWVDVDLDSCNIDLQDVKRKLSAKTRILIFVHWGGCPVDLDEIERIKALYRQLYGQDLYVIEDCAHVWNASYKNKLIGNSGNFCCFSFQAIKFLSTVDGGLIISPSARYHDKMKSMRWFGLDRDKGQSFRCVQDIADWGYKFQPNDVFASIGIKNHEVALRNVALHNDNASFYNETLKNIDGINLLKINKDCVPSYWLYTIRVKGRDRFISKLAKNGIESSPVHARMDKHSCVFKYKCVLPNMDILQEDMVCIPNNFAVLKENREFIVDCIKSGW